LRHFLIPIFLMVDSVGSQKHFPSTYFMHIDAATLMGTCILYQLSKYIPPLPRFTEFLEHGVVVTVSEPVQAEEP